MSAGAARISTAASANIFTNRELESLSRALSLRRLTYVLFIGDKDRYLTQLPVIQEKLVDMLRSPVGDMVHAEVSPGLFRGEDIFELTCASRLGVLVSPRTLLQDRKPASHWTVACDSDGTG